MPCPICIVSARNTKHFGFSNIRFRGGSIIKSVYVIMVVVVSLYHQQSDNFCKIQKNNTKWTGAVIYVGRFSVLSSGAPRICVLHCSEGKRGLSIAGLLAFESIHLAHSHQHPLCQRHWTILNCWTRDNWLFGGKVEVVTTLEHFRNLPQMNWRLLDTLTSSLSVSKISSDI